MHEHFKTHPFRTIECKICGHEHKVPMYCGDRFCSICGKSRLWRIRQRFHHIIKNRKLAPGSSFKHLVLTQRVNADPGDAIRDIVNSFRALRHLARWRRLVTGGAFVIEVNPRPAGWHVHIHAIIESKFYYGRNLTSDWKKCSNGISTDIKEIPVRRAIDYLTSYITKGSPIREESLALNKAFKGKRLFQPFGCWHSDVPTFHRDRFVCEVCLRSQWRLQDDGSGVLVDRMGYPVLYNP